MARLFFVVLGLLFASLADCHVIPPVRSTVCIPTAISVIEANEGRHACAYDSPLGYRAVGAGYNLDERTQEREREVAAVFSDWDKVYSGEECLNNVQITTLLTLDVTRAMSKAYDKIPGYNNWCCNLQAIFADIAFTLGSKDFGSEFDKSIASATAKNWGAAAEQLKKTAWCKRLVKECSYLTEHLRKGCDTSQASVLEMFTTGLV